MCDLTFIGDYFVKKIALVAMLSTCAGLFSSSTGTTQPEHISNDKAYQKAVDSRNSGTNDIQSVLQNVQANPRNNLARRPSVAALNSFNFSDASSGQTQEIGVVTKAGDATAILRTMLKDAMADFEKLIHLYTTNDIRKDLPLIPSFTKDQYGNFFNASPASMNYSAVPNNLAMPINNLAEKIARIGGNFDNYKITLPGSEGEGAVHNFSSLNGPAFEELVKEIVNCNAALRFDLASNGIDPR